METTILNRLLWKPIQTFIGNAMGRKPKSIAPAVKLSQIALHAMPHVSTLSFVYAKTSDGRPDGETFIIFPEILRIVGHRLRHLHIQSPFAIHLPPQLGSLESFSIDAVKPYHRLEIHNVILDKVPAFLLAHHSTIRDVSFSIDDFTLDITPILQCLRDMSCLHTIGLSLCYDTFSSASSESSVDFQGEREILDKHRQHLRSLSISFAEIGWTLPVFFRQDWDWGPARFPKLRDLTIRIRGLLFRRELESYVRLFSSSLVSLKIKHAPFSAQVNNSTFCEMFGHLWCLEYLSLYLSSFNIEQLGIFAITLPHLCSLFIHYSCLPHQEYSVSLLVIEGCLKRC